MIIDITWKETLAQFRRTFLFKNTNMVASPPPSLVNKHVLPVYGRDGTVEIDDGINTTP